MHLHFTKKISFFLLFAGLFYVIFLAVCVKFFPSFAKNVNYRIGSYGHMYSRIQDLKSYGKVDVLFLGSSHAYRGFDPRIFKSNGIRSFTLGSSSQTPIQTEILARRYVDILQPKLVIFEVFPDVFEADGVESSLDLIANDTIGWDTFKMALTLKHLKTFNTLLYGLFRQIFLLDSNFVEEKKRGEDEYISGGFVEKSMSYFDNSETFKEKKWEFRSYQKEAFERSLFYFKGKDIDVVLVTAPVTKELYRSYTNNEEIDSYFENICAKNSLCKGYYNFNEILDLDSHLNFYDKHHLNQRGVEIFNKSLIDNVI